MQHLDAMYDRANAFYKALGREGAHPLWLGRELPRWFFVFLLQYCTLVHCLRLRDAYVLAALD